MNKKDTTEAIKEARLIHQSTFSEAQILLSLELFYMLGEKNNMVKERAKAEQRLENFQKLKIVKA